MRLRLDSGHSLAVGTGDDLNLQLNSGDLLSLLYNGRRLPGLIEAGEIRVGDEGLLVLQGLFPDTGAARRSLDSY